MVGATISAIGAMLLAGMAMVIFVENPKKNWLRAMILILMAIGWLVVGFGK